MLRVAVLCIVTAAGVHAGQFSVLDSLTRRVLRTGKPGVIAAETAKELGFNDVQGRVRMFGMRGKKSPGGIERYFMVVFNQRGKRRVPEALVFWRFDQREGVADSDETFGRMFVADLEGGWVRGRYKRTGESFGARFIHHGRLYRGVDADWNAFQEEQRAWLDYERRRRRR